MMSHSETQNAFDQTHAYERKRKRKWKLARERKLSAAYLDNTPEIPCICVKIREILCASNYIDVHHCTSVYIDVHGLFCTSQKQFTCIRDQPLNVLAKSPTMK